MEISDRDIEYTKFKDDYKNTYAQINGIVMIRLNKEHLLPNILETELQRILI